METRILQSEIRDWSLLMPAATHLVRAPTSRLERSREGELRWPPFEPALHYGLVHAATAGVPSRESTEYRVRCG